MGERYTLITDISGTMIGDVLHVGVTEKWETSSFREEINTASNDNL